MAYSVKQWEIVKAFFEEGLSLAEIVERPEVVITDRSSISKRAKIDGWIKGKNQQLQDDEVQAKQVLAEADKKKSTLNSTALVVHETLIFERVKYSNRVKEMVMENAKGAMEAPCETQMDFKNRSETLKNTIGIIDPVKTNPLLEDVNPNIKEITIDAYLQARAVSIENYLTNDSN